MKPVFLWERHNREHIQTHPVTEEEAEHVVKRAAPPFPETLGEGKLLVRGQTASGRYLQVIFVFRSPSTLDYDSLSLDQLAAVEHDQPAVYVVHARELTNREKRRFRKRR